MIMVTRRFPLLRQLLLATTLATGFGTIWCVLVLWLGTAIEEAWRGGNLPPREDLVVTSDGTPLIVSTPRQNLSLATYRDRYGRVHATPDKDELLPLVYLSGVQWPPGGVPAQAGWESRVRVFLDDREPAVNWFFVHDGKPQGSGYFVGYECVSNRRVGFIGEAGFRTDAPPAGERIPVRSEQVLNGRNWSSFELPLNWGRRWVPGFSRRDVPPRLVHVPSGHRLRLVDLHARTIASVFEAPEPIEGLGIPYVSANSGARVEIEPPILVRTRHKVHCLDHQYKLKRTWTLPTEVVRWGFLDWYEVGDGRAIVRLIEPWPGVGADGASVFREIVYRIADDGAIQDMFELSLKTGDRAMSEQEQGLMLALGVPAPAILLAIEPMILMELERDRVPGYPAAFRAMLRRSWPSVLAGLAFSSALALAAWRRMRAFGLARRERVAWGVFVLLLGVPAYAGMLLSRRWPARVPCPNCHARSARDREACAECGARFPAPSLKGIEIFA
jgi:hypothetical protein